ncbi:hypothetical protein HD554DRAFT_2228359 [Boletus coccyginus]|nr:hypothetical protein HD554DRAFT_2228359 [Boletus coccyginus]
MSHEDSPSPLLLVSTLGVYLDPQSQKEIESVTVKAGGVMRQIHWSISPGGGNQESFDPPLEVLLDANILVSVHCRKTFRGNVVTIPLDPQEVLYGANEEDGKQLYRKTKRKVEVVIGIRSLPSTVPGLDHRRGTKSGVGKSSLIEKVFGVSGVDVSNSTRGKASIDQEHIASDNQRFIVHDSCGFEAADRENLTAVRNFILDRRRRRDLQDQLHAVWLCLAVPYAGGRLLEAGVEEFLKDRHQTLGNIPLVVVFTKLDLLVNTLETDCLEKGEPFHEAALRGRRQESLDRLCLTPVRTAAESDSVPHVAVSTKEGYEDSLAALINETDKNIQMYVKDEAAHYIAAIAQRVNLSLKVALTIAVGEKRYWKTLMASPSFRGHTIKECLHVIHKDIVTVWNFNDPDNTLQKDDFKARLLDTPKLRVREARSIQKTVESSVTLMAALVTIIAGVAGTGGAALPIVVPVVGIAILGKLAHDLYKTSQDVVRQLMAYIVDLTCVMQIVFLLASTRGRAVNVEVIGIAMQAYERVHRNEVHADINDFNVNLAMAPGKCDHVLDKIKELIKNHSIEDEELQRLRQQLP